MVEVHERPAGITVSHLLHVDLVLGSPVPHGWGVQTEQGETEECNCCTFITVYFGCFVVTDLLSLVSASLDMPSQVSGWVSGLISQHVTFILLYENDLICFPWVSNLLCYVGFIYRFCYTCVKICLRCDFYTSVGCHCLLF